MATLRGLDLRLSYGPDDDRLHEFYIPALRASVRYDRMTGYFTSTALAVAAAGVAHLIARGGRMRLLVGAQLDPDDVEAIRRGEEMETVLARRLEVALPDPEALADELQRERLEALAWMVARGTLAIRVVLPTGPDGLPLPADQASEYFHPKVGIFTDAEGNQIAFSGSMNESAAGWERNYEQFMVFRSWTEEGRLYVAEARGRFDRLWEQREPGWMSLPVPEAARQRLLRYTPAHAPERDPLERETHRIAEAPKAAFVLPQEQWKAQIILRYLRDAPCLVEARGLGMATCTVKPWPHQRFVLERVLATYPQSYLIADEVGLGKTVGAGLVLRQLYLSGLVRRALILAPKSVLRQWQEELYEKFNLNVPRYDGKVFWDYFNEEIVPHMPNPWDHLPMVLASSQLVKRADRKGTLLEAQPWDLVIVDEAHHARRRDFLDLNRYRPNRLLTLLNELKERTSMLLLLTATPMQVHPIEVWDLLSLLGLSGMWAADGQYFLTFFKELDKPLTDIDWGFVLDMARAEVAVSGLDEGFARQARRQLRPVLWEQVRRLLDERATDREWKRLPDNAKAITMQMVRRHTPLRRLVLRHTRSLLRRYAEQGYLQEKVPKRDPHLCWIPMTATERELYDHIEEYISHFYRKYEGERKGLGFVMTVYRRRLTSSFYAVRKSLERRLAYLKGRAAQELITVLDEDDLEQEDLSLDVSEDLAGVDRSIFRGEIGYVGEFLAELRQFGDQDSKTQRLLQDLQTIFRQRDTVIIFTQYTDTLDFLRERLRAVYGTQVACYSGRGGERWDGVMWVSVPKEEIKNEFRQGDTIKVLLCTEAASEGLNLQTCGVLINYDMPWNPMRVEQRIGRIDRIDQRYDTVWIYNYFYEDTVETKVYQALGERINWFRNVIGAVQPILARVDRLIQTVAMASGPERERKLQEELQQLGQELATTQAFDLDAWLSHDGVSTSLPTPFTLAEVSAELMNLPGIRDRFRPHETIDKAFWLRTARGEVAVTFDPDTYDAHPNTLQLLSYGNPLWDDLLTDHLYIEETTADSKSGLLLRLQAETEPMRVGWYVCDRDGTPKRIGTLAELRAALERRSELAPWDAPCIEQAREDFAAAVRAEQAAIQRARARREEAQRRALEAQARRVLIQAAFTELALRQREGLFAQDLPPITFDESAVHALARRGYPFAPLLKLVGKDSLRLRPTDPFYIEISSHSRERLQQTMQQLEGQGKQVLRRLTSMGPAPVEAPQVPIAISHMLFSI